MFHHPAWAVDSYSSGHQPGELPKFPKVNPTQVRHQMCQPVVSLTLKDFAHALVAAVIGAVLLALLDAVLGIRIALVLVGRHVFSPMGEGRPVIGGQGWLGGSRRRRRCLCS